jgi:hypothetical protein
MSSKQWLTVATWVLVPVAAIAQEKQTHYAPTDAKAPVTAIGYESAFKGYRSSSEEGNTPDKVWRAANEEMGKLGGHVGHMKDGAAQPAGTSSAAPSAPSQGGSADHSKHH